MAESLTYYACGDTEYDLARVFKGRPSHKQTFPSGVFLFEHASGERVLFDTGYADSLSGTGLAGAIYSRLLPPVVTPEQTIESQLANDGIDCRSVGHVVLSHLHPDHIGGVRYFPDATFIMSEGAVATLAHPRLRDGVLKKQLPEWFDQADKRVLTAPMLGTDHGPVDGFDLYGDGSYIVTEMPGHSRGHLGAFVLGRALLAGDAAWSKDVLPSAADLKTIPKAITYDHDAYVRTADRLQRLGRSGIDLYFSHDEIDKKVLLP